MCMSSPPPRKKPKVPAPTNPWSSLPERQSLGVWACSHLKDLKTSNVQDPNEELTGQLCVQSLVDPRHQPPEQPVVGGLGQSPHGKHDLEVWRG